MAGFVFGISPRDPVTFAIVPFVAAGASTLNAAISLRAHAEIASRPAGGVELRSLDTDRTVLAPRWSDVDGAGDLSLLARLARYYRLEHATLTTRGESPAGAGIAGSS